MTIAEPIKRGKELIGRIPADILIILMLLACSTLAFGLGMVVGKEAEQAKAPSGVWVEELPEKGIPEGGGPAAAASILPTQGSESPAQVYVASKTGTKYYLPSCSGSKRIKEENKVWFRTKEDAEGAGYTPAANCPGL